MNPVVTAIIVTYNSRRWLPRLSESLKHQTLVDRLEVIVVDSMSTDGSLELAKDLFPKSTCVSGGINSFTNSNNIGVQKATGTYVMLVNPDMWLETNCMERLVQMMDEHPEAAAIVPKVQSYYRNQEGKYAIDTTGFVLKKNGTVVDRGQGEVDRGQFETFEEVFGLSGACGIFRKNALQEVAWNGEIFDNNFTLYKEDIDLSWRLQQAGWKVYYDPHAIAHHNRTVRKPRKREALFDERAKRSAWVRAHSYRNGLLILLSHLNGTHLRRYGHAIIPFELAKTAYISVKEPETLAFTFKSRGLLRDAWRKRKHFAKLRKQSSHQLLAWTTKHQ